MDAQRAAQAYYWSLPLVGFAFWRDEQIRVYEAAKFGDFVVFDSLKEKRGIVTANLTTPYIINWTNLSDGPVLIDYPQGQTLGGVLDFWQRPVCDLGLTGPDAGKGGKYMVIAPQEDASKHAARRRRSRRRRDRDQGAPPQQRRSLLHHRGPRGRRAGAHWTRHAVHRPVRATAVTRLGVRSAQTRAATGTTRLLKPRSPAPARSRPGATKTGDPIDS